MTKNALGDFLKTYRESNQMTLKELEFKVCASVGDPNAVSAQTLSQWETGKHRPNRSTLESFQNGADPAINWLSEVLLIALDEDSK